jgi:hypothetical protein
MAQLFALLFCLSSIMAHAGAEWSGKWNKADVVDLHDVRDDSLPGVRDGLPVKIEDLRGLHAELKLELTVAHGPGGGTYFSPTDEKKVLIVLKDKAGRIVAYEGGYDHFLYEFSKESGTGRRRSPTEINKLQQQRQQRVKEINERLDTLRKNGEALYLAQELNDGGRIVIDAKDWKKPIAGFSAGDSRAWMPHIKSAEVNDFDNVWAETTWPLDSFRTSKSGTHKTAVVLRNRRGDILGGEVYWERAYPHLIEFTNADEIKSGREKAEKLAEERANDWNRKLLAAKKEGLASIKIAFADTSKTRIIYEGHSCFAAVKALLFR